MVLVAARSESADHEIILVLSASCQCCWPIATGFGRPSLPDLSWWLNTTSIQTLAQSSSSLMSMMRICAFSPRDDGICRFLAHQTVQGETSSDGQLCAWLRGKWKVTTSTKCTSRVHGSGSPALKVLRVLRQPCAHFQSGLFSVQPYGESSSCLVSSHTRCHLPANGVSSWSGGRHRCRTWYYAVREGVPHHWSLDLPFKSGDSGLGQGHGSVLTVLQERAWSRTESLRASLTFP